MELSPKSSYVLDFDQCTHAELHRFAIHEIGRRDILDRNADRFVKRNFACVASPGFYAGEDFADCTRPEKIAWARGGDETGGFRPGVLTIACEGARALFLTHAQGELIQRINSFFGFAAVHQIRIVQKPDSQAIRRSRTPPPLKGEAARKLEGMMEGIENDKLRQAIQRLGTAVMGKRGNQR